MLLVTFPGPRHLNCWAARLREPEPRWWLREGENAVIGTPVAAFLVAGGSA